MCTVQEEVERTIQARSFNVSMRDLNVEYFADVEIMTQADVFIGSLSNMYIHVAALRYARYPQRPDANTCFVNHQGQLICEDNPNQKHGIWHYHMVNLHGGTAFPPI
jgi:hypothetical protein